MGAECEKCCSMGDDVTDYVPGQDQDQNKNYTTEKMAKKGNRQGNMQDPNGPTHRGTGSRDN